MRAPLFLYIFTFLLLLNTVQLEAAPSIKNQQADKLNESTAAQESKSEGQTDTASSLPTLREAVQTFKLYDEILTQSIRSYVYTNDEKWLKRHKEHVLKLDGAIAEIITHYSSSGNANFNRFDQSNDRLYELENEIIALVQDGNRDAAIAILDGYEYTQEKDAYTQSLNLYVIDWIDDTEKRKGAATVALEEHRFPYFQAAFILVLVSIFLFFALNILHKSKVDPLAYQFSSKQAKSVGVIGLSALIGIVCLAAWIVLDRVEARMKRDYMTSLETVLQTTDEALQIWAHSNLEDLSNIARDPAFLELTAELLKVPREKESLLRSNAQKNIRQFFYDHLNKPSVTGFFIIAPDHMSLASMRDENIGTTNIIARKRSDLLTRVFDGNRLFISPISSEVVIDDGGTASLATAFFATPIKDTDGEIIAVLTIRIDPTQSFTRITQTGRIGESGETYAFDRDAMLITESRFDEQLQEMGLVPQGGKGILNVHIRVPVKGNGDSGDNPLTVMAEHAINGEAGGNVDGYSDYRGIAVIGAWLWDDKLNLGLTTEIDHAEAFGTYRYIRNALFSLLAVTLTLSIISVLFNYFIGDKANKALHEASAGLELEVDARTIELREARDKAEIAGEAKESFLAHMSHELRSPLNSIIGFTQIMERNNALSGDDRENLSVISRNGDHLLKLINSILELSKIEAGMSILDICSFDLFQLLDSLNSMKGLCTDRKGLTITFECDKEVPRYLRTDENRLRQILINLIDNAIKFTDAGGITVNVKTYEKNQKNTGDDIVIWFQVIDTGCGISPDECKLLFKAFKQSGSEIRSNRGTGLGLTISRKFAQLMNGDISIESEIGKGSTFKFNITAKVADGASIDTKKSAERRVKSIKDGQKAKDGSDFRILIVDDIAGNRFLLRKTLKQVGLHVKEAENGKDAVEVSREWKPHLIWMDLRMPVLDGYKATRQIKDETKNSDTQPIIIALTAHAFEEERTAAIAHGCDDFIRKPFKEHEIFDALNEYLGIQYIYEDVIEESIDSKPASATRSSPDDMARLPQELLEKLKDATELGDMAMLDDVIGSIRTENDALADTLENLAKSFAYDEIIQAIDETENKL